MRRKAGLHNPPAERIAEDLCLRIRKRYSAEEKVGIVLDGLRFRSRA
jgi:hypothetical protein